MRIGSLILFKNGYCYQSYGWNLLRPLGKLQNIVNHLDKYLVDDITIIRPVREDDNRSSFLSDLKELRHLKTSTPISFGGGIRNKNQLALLRDLPFERFVFSSNLFNNDNVLIDAATEQFGKQAIVGLIPFKVSQEISVFNSQLNKFVSFDQLRNTDSCDEIILYDCKNEGFHHGFSSEIVEKIRLDPNKCVFAGGVTNVAKSIKDLLFFPKAICIENAVLHREFSKLNYYEKL
jgi:phosphoribosylformimino-5-aminoimidazole carboxamide ribonucleotide (ProFAR) isomerase